MLEGRKANIFAQLGFKKKEANILEFKSLIMRLLLKNVTCMQIPNPSITDNSIIGPHKIRKLIECKQSALSAEDLIKYAKAFHLIGADDSYTVGNKFELDYSEDFFRSEK